MILAFETIFELGREEVTSGGLLRFGHLTRISDTYGQLASTPLAWHGMSDGYALSNEIPVHGYRGAHGVDETLTILFGASVSKA